MREVENMFIHPCAPHDVLFIVDIVLNAVSICRCQPDSISNGGSGVEHCCNFI